MPDGNSPESAGESLHQPAPSVHTPEADAPIAHASSGKQPQRRPLWMWIAGGALILLALYEVIPWAITAFRTESTDDAYVNGHVTFVAPRVPGQVVRVLVDDNNRVRKGDLLVQLDKEPYQVKVEIAQAALSVAQAGIVTAQTKVRGIESLGLSQRFDLANAAQKLNNQVADLHSKVDVLQAANATLVKARADYGREQQLYQQQVISKSEFDSFQKAFSVAQAQQQEAQHDAASVRAELGLPPTPRNGDELSGIPANLDQTYSAVKVAQARLMQTASELGVFHSFNETPDEMLAEFYKRDSSGNINAIFDEISKNAPDTKQAEAKLEGGSSQSRSSRAEPFLLRCRGRDRRCRDASQRQPRRSGHRRAGADGVAISHRYLGRRQLQGDATEESAHRTTGGARRRHVRQSPALSGSRFRIHDGNRIYAGAIAGRECDRKLRQGCAAAAGANRIDQLRS